MMETVGYDSPAGFAFAHLLDMTKAIAVVCSTPENGPNGEKVMSCLERAGAFTKSKFIGTYDFKGSASAEDCAIHSPDKDMTDEEWSNPDNIMESQWMRYWMGRSRGTMQALLETATPMPYTLETSDDGYLWTANTRFLFCVSVQGGPITQTEKKNLPHLQAGTVADITTREVSHGGPVEIYWVHFDTVENCLKALQGYGGLKFSPMWDRRRFNLPGEWEDGNYNPKYDLLSDVPGESPEERRAWLLEHRPPRAVELNARLMTAINVRSADIVKMMLAKKADPMCCEKTGISALGKAGVNFCPEVVQELLNAGADVNQPMPGGSDTPWEYAKHHAGNVQEEEAMERVAATLELLKPTA